MVLSAKEGNAGVQHAKISTMLLLLLMMMMMMMH